MTKEENQILAASKLLQIIANTKDSVKVDRYLGKLEKVTGISYRKLEEALSKIRQDIKTPRPKQEVIDQTVRSLFTHPIEEQCLALLLQHPELKNMEVELLPEYFENSENREIFIAWQKTGDSASLRENVDAALREHFDNLAGKSILATRIEERYNDYVLSLKREYNRSLERKKEAILALEAEMGGTPAELAKLEEQGIEPSQRLREVFAQKARRGRGEQRR